MCLLAEDSFLTVRPAEEELKAVFQSGEELFCSGGLIPAHSEDIKIELRCILD